MEDPRRAAEQPDEADERLRLPPLDTEEGFSVRLRASGARSLSVVLGSKCHQHWGEVVRADTGEHRVFTLTADARDHEGEMIFQDLAMVAAEVLDDVLRHNPDGGTTGRQEATNGR